MKITAALAKSLTSDRFKILLKEVDSAISNAAQAGFTRTTKTIGYSDTKHISLLKETLVKNGYVTYEYSLSGCKCLDISWE